MYFISSGVSHEDISCFQVEPIVTHEEIYQKGALHIDGQLS